MRAFILIALLAPKALYAQHVRPVYPDTIEDQFIDHRITDIERININTIALFLDNTVHGQKLVCAVHDDNGRLIASTDVITTNLATTVIIVGVVRGGEARCVDAEATRQDEQ